jgi:hypothetical protein
VSIYFLLLFLILPIISAPYLGLAAGGHIAVANIYQIRCLRTKSLTALTASYPFLPSLPLPFRVLILHPFALRNKAKMTRKQTSQKLGAGESKIRTSNLGFWVCLFTRLAYPHGHGKAKWLRFCRLGCWHDGTIYFRGAEGRQTLDIVENLNRP